MRLFDAISQLAIAISRRTPLVLILDDLHWADRGTVAMLSHVAHFVSGNSILLIGAYRDAEVDRKHPLSVALLSISRQRNFEQVQLSGLEESDRRQSAVHPRGAPLPHGRGQDTAARPGLDLSA